MKTALDLTDVTLPRIRRKRGGIVSNVVQFQNGIMDYFDEDNRPSRDLTAANSNQPHLTIPASAHGARVVARMLQDGIPMIDVAGHCGDHRVFGLGCMLHNIIQKEHAEDFAASVDVLMDMVEDLIPHDAGVANGDAFRTEGWPCRNTIIQRLVDQNAIKAKMGVRQVKPSGSIATTSEIGHLVAINNKIPYETIISACRLRPTTKARFTMIWAMREICGMSLSMIGSSLGGRDHTTILSALNRIPEERIKDKAFRVATNKICREADLLASARHHRILSSQFVPAAKSA